MSAAYILSSLETYVVKFRLYGTKVVFKFNSPPEGVEEMHWIRQGLNELVEIMTKDTTDEDYLGFTLRSLNFKNKEPGFLAFRRASEVSADILWNIFGGIIQSNSAACTSCDTFKVECTKVKVPMGRGQVRPGLYNNFDEECSARKGIVVIKNTDSLCLPCSLVVAIAHAEKDKDYKLIRMNRCNRQTLRARQLMLDARVQFTDEGAGVRELHQFQNHLPLHKITVYSYGNKGRDIYFEGEVQNPRYRLNLIFHKGHFNVITSLTAAFACKFYCEACHIPFDHRYKHRCSSTCYSCKRSPPCLLENDGIYCGDCNRKFMNRDCFTAHLKNICKSVKKCPSCEKMIIKQQRHSKHVCGETYCKVCNEFMEPNHRCYMKVDYRKPMSEGFLFIFFDLETRQDEVLDSANVHRVNLCISQQFCWKCINGDSCQNCLDRIRVFRDDPVNDFMSYVMEVRKAYKKVCILAHNGQSFDFQFLLKYVLEKTQFTPELITRGTKVILMEIDNVKFIDSLNYMPMALSKLPKAFDLPPEKKKGYFPHLFNTLANENYVGPIPSKEFYCPDSMFDQGYKDFTKWHDEQIRNEYEFDFQKEIFEYCLSDVDILAQACIKFRASFLKECNVDPFLEAVTIASACNLAFRRNFLKPNTIGIVPKIGYRSVDLQSKIALQWLTWEEDQRGIRMDHAGRGREVVVDGVKVDGVCDGKVFEFHGCYWHGCPKCFPHSRNEPLKDDPSDTHNARLARTRAKIAKLARHEVVEMWECDFRKLKHRNVEMAYLDSHPMMHTVPLNPRDAFFGGRTGNTKSYTKCKEGETIQYVDVCSLYPWVCKYGKYPVGHPKIHIGDGECRKQGMTVDGLLKCTILPPRELYHPVLPAKMNQKLMFVLCRTCGQNLLGECTHNIDERVLTGTWTMDEIRKAVDKGYVIIEMYELWEYKMASFDNGDGLFTGFINKFLKIKQEASGYPGWCQSEEDRAKYIEDYFINENIKLDPNKICKNEGLRSLAKLMLNSFWGKFGQRENQTKTSIVRQPSELFKMLVSPSVDVNHIQEVNEDVVVVNWQYVEDSCEVLPTVNVVLAAFTTAHARLKLYDYLDALDTQVAYYDTDSVIYLHREGLHKVETGDYLGQMTDELADYGAGSFITEFVSGGPKTYSYKVLSTKSNDPVTVCKVKGLSLNLRTSGVVNFESMKRMVLDREDEPLAVTDTRIKRTKDREVITVSETKMFKITGAKRKRDGEYDSLPYGYIKIPRQEREIC